MAVPTPVRAREILFALVGAAITGLVAWAWASATPAGADDETYTAVAPCAIFDSRVDGPNGGDHLRALQEWQVQISGSPAGQGATIGGCGIPGTATAVQINLVAVNALTEGNIRLFEPGGTFNGGTVNYQTLTPKLNNSNAVTVPVSQCQPPLPASQRCLVLQPNAGPGANANGDPTVHARGIVLGYFDTGLADRMAAVEALLDGLSRETVDGRDTLRLTGANLQLVDGTGDTACSGGTFVSTAVEPCNGLGNLIVGYHRNTGDTRSGAHGIIVSDDHSYASYGHLIAGSGNEVTGREGAALGRGGLVSGSYATVTGGSGNEAAGTASSVSGGQGGEALGDYSSVSGGSDNSSPGAWASVTGGSGNTAAGSYSSVTGGNNNAAAATGLASTVSGGQNRNTFGSYDWAAGSLFETN